MNFVKRDEWTNRPPKRVVKGTLSKSTTGHWNGPTVIVSGKSKWNHSTCASILRGIQNFHMDSRNWSDIAYNFAVCPHGYVFELRGLNTWNGANGTNEGNRSNHAVLFIAGEDNEFTEEERKAFVDCVQYIADHNSIEPLAIGHRDHKSTACPGDDRYRWIKDGMKLANTNNDEEGLIMFKEGTDIHGLVKDAYQKIVGREVESQKTLDTWAWVLFTQQGAGYAKLSHGLLYERRRREDAKFELLIKALAEGNTNPTLELTEEQEQELLAKVYADLTERLK